MLAVVQWGVSSSCQNHHCLLVALYLRREKTWSFNILPYNSPLTLVASPFSSRNQHTLKISPSTYQPMPRPLHFIDFAVLRIHVGLPMASIFYFVGQEEFFSPNHFSSDLITLCAKLSGNTGRIPSSVVCLHFCKGLDLVNSAWHEFNLFPNNPVHRRKANVQNTFCRRDR